jgi:hypothetical protein
MWMISITLGKKMKYKNSVDVLKLKFNIKFTERSLKFVGYDGPRRNFGAKIKQAYL